MTTTTAQPKDIRVSSRFNARDFVATLLEHISNSLSDMIVTVAVIGISAIYIMQLLPHEIAGQFVGLYILGMMVQLFIRIVHRFDEQYTTNELAERLIEMDNRLNEKLDRIDAGVIDINISQIAKE